MLMQLFPHSFVRLIKIQILKTIAKELSLNSLFSHTALCSETK